MDNQQRQDEVSLKVLLLKTGDYARELIRYWKITLAVVILSLGYTIFTALTTPKKFQAELTFMVNEDESSQLGGVEAVLESIGISGAAANSEYNLDKILQLSKSQRVLFDALLDSSEVKGKRDLNANHLIRVQNLHKVWKREKPKLVKFFFTHDSLAIFNRQESTALKYIYGMVLGNNSNTPLLTTTILEDPGIMSMTLVTRSEEFSYQFLSQIFRHLSQFYIDKTTEKQFDTYRKVSQQVDSIRVVMAKKEYELANFSDRNQSLVTETSALRRAQLERDVFVLNTMYGEAVKNEEIAKFALKNKTPFVQPIDFPFPPLKVIRVSLPKSIIIGILFGLFFSALFLLGRKALREVMATPAEEGNI